MFLREKSNLLFDCDRYNPAGAGEVTGKATYASFYSSLLKAKNQGAGVHFC